MPRSPRFTDAAAAFFANALEDEHGRQRTAEQIERLVMDEFPHLERSDMAELWGIVHDYLRKGRQ